MRRPEKVVRAKGIEREELRLRRGRALRKAGNGLAYRAKGGKR